MDMNSALLYATFISVIIAILYNVGKGMRNFWNYKVKGAVSNKDLIKSIQTIDNCKTQIDATQKSIEEINRTIKDIQENGTKANIAAIEKLHGQMDAFTEKVNVKLEKMGRKIWRINERVYLIEAKANGGLDKTPRFPEDDEEP